ncbi:GtrA family protein [Bacillus sp. S13(2024)]|uniref:GtrA family protein n=1 Tax=unclassified Bacillus (in: firmicutes) TaxID=185979 RepID=UPI003D1A102B
MNKGLIQILKFLAVGVLNTGIDIMIFTLLVMGETPFLLAQWISYSCGVASSYLLNRQWTFQQKGRKQVAKEPLKFICVNLLSLVVVSLILSSMHDTLEQSLAVSKVTATLIGSLINFIGSRYWVFRFSCSKGVEPNEN